MKQLFRLFVILLNLSMLASSCQQAPLLTMTGSRTYNFTREGGTQSFTFSCNRDWSVSASENWITVSPSSGTPADGEITVRITCSANTTYDGRSATITVRVEDLSETITVTQDTGIGLILSPTTFDLTNEAQDIVIEVQKNVQYAVTIDEASKSWIAQKGTKALSSEKVTFSIAANESYDNREGKITFKQTDGDLVQTVTVKQSQTNGLFITTPEYDLSNEAHTLTVEVKANVEFEVSSQAEWIKYGSTSTKALTPSQITLRVNANETYDDREGKVIVKQKGGNLTGTITIRQDENYGIFVSQESVSIGKEEQKVEVEVKYNVDFDVVVPESAMGTMITTIEDDEGNTGTKALSTRKYRFGVSENSAYDPREVSITFKQKDGTLSGTFTISQAQKDGIIVDQKLYEVGRDGETIEIPLQTNVEYEVIIPDEAKEWIKRVDSAPTKGLVSESVYLEVAENATYYNREASVVIKKKDADLSENIVIKQAQTDALFITDEVKEFNLSSKGGDVTVNVFHNIPFEVDKTNLPDWITTSIVDKDSYNATLTISVEKNTLYKGRNTTVTIKGGTLSDVLSINEHQVDIVYTDITEYKVGWKGGDFSIKIYSNVDYTYEKPEWASLKSESSVVEDPLKVSEIVFSVSENLDYAKEGQIIIKWNNEGNNETNYVSLRQENCTISLAEPGGLLSEITTDRVAKVRVLTLLGSLNGSDIVIVRRMSNLVHLDMSDAHIVEGGAVYYKEYVTENNIIGQSMFNNCFQEKEATIILPKDVIEIKSEAFSGCHKLVSVSLPGQLRILGDYTFAGCWVLKDVTLPEGLTHIGLGVFDYCRAIEEITIPCTVQKIESYAFRDCTALTKIKLKTLPTVLKSIGSDLFVVRQNARQIYDNATLYVPTGTKDAYYLTDFGNFATIIEE